MQLETWTITGAGFHFGRHGLGQEETSVHLPSDSLFAALAARLAALQGAAAVDAWLEPFRANAPPFVLSSTFPFAGSVRYYPAPAWKGQAEKSGADAKQLKKVQFISEKLFQAVCAGKPLADLFPQAHYRAGLLTHPDEKPGLPETILGGEQRVWEVEKTPRVALGRVVQNSQIYFTGRVQFAPGCGLWFAVRWLEQDAARQALFENLLADLGEAGLGGERSVGYGACSFERMPAAPELPLAENQSWISLSRYLPQPDEVGALAAPSSAYSLVRVGGWLVSPVRRDQRRRTVNLIQEGAVLGPLPRSVPGQVVDVRPRYKAVNDPLGHPVYRCGLAFSTPFKGGLP